ncbi:MAG: SCP2 sterol-binding domain-containing protein [Anaerolineales bacterium]
MTLFPSEEWLTELEQKLNSDVKYNETANQWEGDLLLVVTPTGNLTQPVSLYLDLWHGTCRKTEYNPAPTAFPIPAFTLTASYENITAVLEGQLNPVTAMMSGKLNIKGNMGYILRNVPSVLEFVRCAHEITTEVL